MTGEGVGVKFVQDHQMTSKELDQLAPQTPVLILSHPAYMTNTAGEKLIGEIYKRGPGESSRGG